MIKARLQMDTIAPECLSEAPGIDKWRQLAQRFVPHTIADNDYILQLRCDARKCQNSTCRQVCPIGRRICFGEQSVETCSYALWTQVDY